MTPQQRFEALGVELPPLVTIPPTLSFRTWRRTGNLVFLAGHGPNREKMPPEFDFVGKVGAELTRQQGYNAARLVGLSLLRTIEDALQTLNRVTAVLEVQGAVNSAPGFTDQSFVLNGCSELMIEIFGPEIGKPARMAFGVAQLPFNMAVEIKMVIEVA
jgi:enamine deaminase RidA (YjgF/YER057c/UK114 family)